MLQISVALTNTGWPELIGEFLLGMTAKITDLTSLWIRHIEAGWENQNL